MQYPYFIICLLLFFSCNSKKTVTPAQKNTQLTNYVNPFIGTGGHGHTYPGATLPFGMMQLSPDTRLTGWDGCSGYHYSDNYIYGFSHTHLSGTGVSDYGDILLMPTTTKNFHNGSDGKKGYRAPFSHNTEIAKPGYYKVHLDSTNINVQLTVTKRSGMHQYTFNDASNQYIVLDLEHRDQLLDYKIEQTSPTTFQGYRHSKAWAANQQLFYYFEISHEAITTYNNSNKPTKAILSIQNPKNEPVTIKIGISAVSINGAKQNLNQEIANKTFKTIKTEAQQIWEKQLEKIVVNSSNNNYKTNFYTALYHTMIAPNLYQDVDGKYRGMDLNVHQTNDFNYYTVFSLWDTYRATHPLYTIIEQDKTNDFINTFLAKYDEGGILPIWDLSANYTGCMIGYHAIPVIADAYLKGIQNYDTAKAFKAMKYSANQDKLGLKSYKTLGYIAVEEESESVSKTLEYAYDDWCIAQMAKTQNKKEDYKNFIRRAQYYKNVLDPETQFMRGRFRNTWINPFDPFEVNFNYTEANAWQYSNYVPQDLTGYIKLIGGKKQMEKNLDTLFSVTDKTSGRHQVDITGLIGQYAHGNEPSHHMAYLYNFVNKPYKTQEKVHQILTTLYTNTHDGISGNEDCGQMSAWYVFSSLGFYPVTPASNQYIIGTPLFEKATLNLENGRQFTVSAPEVSNSNKYINQVYLNGKKLNRTYITHQEIMHGGHLKFEMSNQPTSWGTTAGEEPVIEITDYPITPAPFIAEGNTAFKNETIVTLKNIDTTATIFYSINKESFKPYNEPFVIKEAVNLHVYADKNNIKSQTITTKFYKIDPNISIQLDTQYYTQYHAGGNNALIDGIIGTKDFRTGTWQGYHNVNVVATVNLGSVKKINTISANFLADQRSWIFYPKKVSVLLSRDGKKFTPLKTEIIDATKSLEEVSVLPITFTCKPNEAQYVKLIAETLGDLPEWHIGHSMDGKSFIFIDEITIQ